ncbi:hypothetical protein [Lysobacter terrae]
MRTQRILAAILLVLGGSCWASEFEGRKPQVFSPGNISGPAHDSAPTFTPTGDTVYFGRSNPQQSVILVSDSDENGGWTKPEVAPFSGQWNDMEPAMSPDGNFIVFISNRPDAEGGAPVEGFFSGKSQKGGRLWRADRTRGGWSKPYRLPDRVNSGSSIYAPSVAADGSIYFMTTDKTTGRFRLYRSQYREGTYQSPTTLPFSDGSFTDVDPAISPDESFLIFGSSRKAGRGIDLFVVLRKADVWGEPVHLGDEINSPLSDAEPRLSPDGKDLYFSSERTLPVQFPRSEVQATEDTKRMEQWDNGNYNIWKVPLVSSIAAAIEP